LQSPLASGRAIVSPSGLGLETPSEGADESQSMGAGAGAATDLGSLGPLSRPRALTGTSSSGRSDSDSDDKEEQEQREDQDDDERRRKWEAFRRETKPQRVAAFEADQSYLRDYRL